ncbi:glycosyltransferase [Microbacterium arabinogalactanolyticum]|uniref:glycosyltransferase n=1 Tax=Microbacterium arabinogalactanolyticum TaxID=69365 RepID=UPI0040441ADE
MSIERPQVQDSPTDARRPPAHLPRSTRLFLLLVGIVVALASFIVVLVVPDLRPPHTPNAPEAAGASSGSPGIDLLLAAFGGAESTASWQAVKVVLALTIALPSIWMPLAIARIFRRARAGYVYLFLPVLLWLLNDGTILIGTEFGLYDDTVGARVPVSLGLVAATTFLGLSVALLLSTHRLTWSRLSWATVLLLALASVAAMFGWLGGIAVGATVAVLWWQNLSARPKHLLPALLVALAVCAAAFGVNALGTQAVRSAGIAPATASADQIWHDLYVGLAYPQLATDGRSVAGVSPADIADATDGADWHERYTAAADANPNGVVAVYFQKALDVLKHYGAMIIVVLVGFVLALTRRAGQRRSLFAAILIAVPALLLGTAYAVATMPTPFHLSVLSAGLGYLVAVALGALAWSITSMPAHVRATERNRMSGRQTQLSESPELPAPSYALSVIIPTRNGADVLPETLDLLGQELGPDDEIIVVENGSTDDTTEVVSEVARAWVHDSTIVLTHSAPGLGEALRIGVLTSRGRRLLLSADDLPFGFTDLVEFKELPESTVVAVGSKAHPDSVVARSRLRTIQSRIFRFLRSSLLQSRVGDSQGTLWVDGAWGREFALASREDGLMWTTELVLAAEQQHHRVAEVPVTLAPRHETGASRFKLGDAWKSFVGFTRLAVYKDDYAGEDWERSTRPDVVVEQ